MQPTYMMLSESLRVQSIEGLYLHLMRATALADSRTADWLDETPGRDVQNTTPMEARVSIL